MPSTQNKKQDVQAFPLIGSSLAVTMMVVVLTLICAPARASPELTIQRGFNHLNLAALLEYHVDATSQLDLEDVRSLPPDVWLHSESSNLTFGFTEASHWFRMTLHNGTAETRELLLQMAYARFDSIEVYIDNGSEIHYQKSGKDQAFQDRKITHRHHLFPVHLNDGESLDIYIRGRTTGVFNFPLVLWQKDRFYEADQVNLILNGAYFGVWLLVLIFNAVLYSVMPNRALASFLGMIFSFGVYHATSLGFGTTSLWGYYPGLYDGTIVFSVAFALLCLGWLASNILELEATNPIGHAILKATTYPALLAIVAYPIFGYGPVIGPLAALSVPAAVTVFVLGVHSAINGNRLAGYASFAWSALLVGIVLRVLNRFEVVPNNFLTEQILPTGFIVMIISLSFVAAAEYRRRNPRLTSALADPENEPDHTPDHHDLEDMVSQRTEELEGALKELSQVNETLREINTMDPVTGIKNRHYFDTIFEQEWRRAHREGYPLSVMLLDIDHFKRVNDTYGHLAGDECLREVAATISKTIKRPADILARYGGEEFVAVLPYIENDNALTFANRIRERVEAAIYLADGHEVNVTVSIGVCTATPNDHDDRKDMISAADIALYEAKNSGRNRVCNAGQLTVHKGNVAS
ncbi:MAG: sensor domain-containing diguanylate cyclase [Proteobacteria bacterium]|nr:sensor domain-containing diguanylate cyclase [Pseudomonadota bacterium]